MPRPVHTATHSVYGRAAVVGEDSYILTGPRERWDGTSPVILAFHGATAAETNELYCDPLHGSPPANHLYLQAVADAGFIVLSSEWGGVLWGNDASTAKVHEAYAWAVAAGAKNGPAGYYSGSMGAVSALNYERAWPAEVGARLLVVPALNMDNVYADNPTHQAGMDAAYGGSYATNGTDHSPHNFVDELADLPTVIWYASDDTLVRAADVTSFAAALGETASDIGPGGHSALQNLVPAVEDLIAAFRTGL